MMILVGDVVDVLRCGEVALHQVGGCFRLFAAKGDVVQSHGAAAVLREADDVVALQTVKTEVHRLQHGLVIVGQLALIAHRAHRLAIDLHRQVEGSVVGQTYGQLAFLAVGGESETSGRGNGKRRTLKKIAPSVIPGEVVYFVECVIVVSRRVAHSHESRAVHGQRFLVALGNEVVAIIRIWIARAREGCVRTPAYRPRSPEQATATHCAGGHFLQVVGSLHVGRREQLWLQSSAIAINPDLVYIAESGTAHHLGSELMDTRLCHADLCPSARGQNGVSGVAGRVGLLPSHKRQPLQWSLSGFASF